MNKQDIQLVQPEMVAISKLENNKGQIEGLPKNPRFIKNERYEKLLQSIKDFPAMLGYREVVCVEFEGKYVVIGGNMRLRALKEVGFKEVPCKILPENTPAEILREITIKDNVSFGDNDNDLLANEWDIQEITNWGLPTIEWGVGDDNEENELVDTVNKGDENSEWVDMPEFELAEKDIKLTIVFQTELEREVFVKEHKIEITNKNSGQWTSRL